MMSFLTGSRVYGTPKPDSDFDLVVLVDGQTLAKLCEAAVKSEDLGSPGGTHYEDGTSLRFGALNLLCVTEKNHFDVWQKGTEELKSQGPVTRDFAIEYLATLRRRNKIGGWG